MYISERPPNLRQLSYFYLNLYRLPFKICHFISLKVAQDQPDKKTRNSVLVFSASDFLFSTLTDAGPGRADGGRGGMGTGRFNFFSRAPSKTYYRNVFPELHLGGLLKKKIAVFSGVAGWGSPRCNFHSGLWGLFPGSLGAQDGLLRGWPSHSAAFPVPQVVLRRAEPRGSGGHADESSPGRRLPHPEAGGHRLVRHHLQVSAWVGAGTRSPEAPRQGRVWKARAALFSCAGPGSGSLGVAPAP